MNICHKKRLKIPKRYLKTVHEGRTDNAMTKREWQRDKKQYRKHYTEIKGLQDEISHQVQNKIPIPIHKITEKFVL